MAASEGIVGRFKAAAIQVPSFVDRMNEKEKMRLYNKYNCSEVNVYIYFRDRPFFDAYLAPYLQSKIEKSFLDVWLTGGDVSRFLQPQFFDRLNAFERALLASRVSEEEGALG